MKRAILVMTVLLCAWPAAAKWKPEYAQASPEIQKWFSSQHNAHGGWCCDQADGERYDSNYTMNNDGSVTLADGTRIEAWKVLTGPNPTGHAILWHTGSLIYCFAAGPMF